MARLIVQRLAIVNVKNRSLQKRKPRYINYLSWKLLGTLHIQVQKMKTVSGKVSRGGES